MELIELAREAQVHREVYIAILQGALAVPGSKRALAQQVGITPEYLSYLLDPHDRVPSPEVAEKIAAAVPLEPEQRQDLLEHMVLASERRVRLRAEVAREAPVQSTAVTVDTLRAEHHAATITTNPAEAKAHYRAVREACRAVLRLLPRAVEPLDVIEVHFLLHDIDSVLNQHGQALFHARQAHDLWDSLDEDAYPAEQERVDRYHLQALRARAVSYANLKLPHQAYDCCQEALGTRALRAQPEMWKPHLYRDAINALSAKPRFALSEVEGYADQVRAITTRRADAAAPLALFLVDRSLARAYLRYGNRKKARQLVDAYQDRLDAIPYLGPLHRVGFFSTCAQLRWAEHDQTEWASFAGAALDIATSAGLHHQIATMQQAYGTAFRQLRTQRGAVTE